MVVQRLPLQRNGSGKMVKTKWKPDGARCNLLIISCFVTVSVFSVFEANKLFVGKKGRYNTMFVILFRGFLELQKVSVTDILSL